LLKRNEVVKLENEIVDFEMSRDDHTIGIVFSTLQREPYNKNCFWNCSERTILS
jgi:ABC-type uncharacterized transport system substrate-binding protein